MITQLELNTFKCFEVLKLPMAPLTLLSGINASGKSSVLQSIVLLHQTMLDYEWSTRLMLNGSVIKLGTVTDVVDQVTGRDSFSIGLADQYTNCRWQFSGDRQDMSLRVDLVESANNTSTNPPALRFLMPVDAALSDVSLTKQVRDLTYITAEREGPRETYPLEDQHAVRSVGPQGENVVSVLYRGRDENIATELRIEHVAPTVLHQVGARLASFFSGCAIDVQQVPNANAVTLGIRTSSDTRFLRPVHCGFGITQILPIIVAILSRNRGSLLLIENPEVHLHPAGQALMGQLLAEAAQAGIQIIVETHSDHVLNGIRRSVKSARISADDVAIHFFRPRLPDAAQVLTPNIDSSGNIDIWPEGFFDQFDKDMDYFADWIE